MAGFLSEYLSHELLDHVFGAATYTPPSSLWCALFTAAPDADGTGGTEVTGGSYARIEVVNNATNFPAASGQTKRNAVPLSRSMLLRLTGATSLERLGMTMTPLAIS